MINQTTIEKTGTKEDGQKVNEILSLRYFIDNIQSPLEKIPVSVIRQEIITYTRSLYESIQAMKTTFKIKDKKTVSGQDLLSIEILRIVSRVLKLPNIMLCVRILV